MWGRTALGPSPPRPKAGTLWEESENAWLRPRGTEVRHLKRHALSGAARRLRGPESEALLAAGALHVACRAPAGLAPDQERREVFS